MTDLFLRFVDVEKAFGPKKVLRGVNLDVVRGETVVVLGGSGSGKSVLLRHAVGLFRPDAGQVFVEGVEISNLRRRRAAGDRARRWGCSSSRGPCSTR